MTPYSPPAGGRHRAAVPEPPYQPPPPSPPSPVPAPVSPPPAHGFGGYPAPVAPALVRAPRPDPPALWPIVPAVALFGILGSLFARWQMRKARRLGYSTGRYWGAWAAGFAIHGAFVIGVSLTMQTMTSHNLKTQLAAATFEINGVSEHVVVDDCHSVSTTFYSGDGTYRCEVILPDGSRRELSAVMRGRNLVAVGP